VIAETTRLTPWWLAKKDVHSDVTAFARYLQAANRGLREDARFHMELCSNFSVSGNGTDGNSIFARRAVGKIRFNLTQAAVDTGASLILSNRTVPMALTSDGDFSLQRRAERWTRAVQGQMHSLGVFELAADIGVDALQTGTGFALGWVETDEGDGGRPVNPRPCLERILPNEILVDSVDGQYRSPRSIYRIKFIAREQLISMYPQHERLIKVSGGPNEQDYIDFFISRDNKADFVRVVEAWHLPSRKGQKDGRHVICTDNLDLRVEPYTRQRFPIIAYRYAERRIGYHGQGLVERVTPAQVRLSELQQSKRDMQRLCSNPYLLIEENSGVEFDMMTNMPGQQVKYRGTPPQIVVFEGTPADLSQEEAQIKAEVWEQEGFSASVQQGEVNKGLSSARAVRAADDVASRRHVMPIRLVEAMYLDFTKLIEDLNDQCAEIDPEYTVTGRYRSGRRSWIKEDRWVDLKLPENDAQINVFPISALPTTPMGMWSALEEMTAAGQVGKSMAQDLQQLPDVASFDTLATSNLDLTRWQIDRMLDGIPELPIPQQFFFDPAESPALVTQAMLVAFRMEAPDEIIQLFEAYLAHAQTLTTQAPAPLQQAPAALDANAAAAAQVALAQQAPAPMAPQGMAA
jgi:hypothetical protein